FRGRYHERRTRSHAGGDALVVYSAGLEKVLVEEKDRGLLEALRLVDDRLVELPAELDEPGMPIPVIQLALDLLASPFMLQAGAVDAGDPEAGFPFYAQIALREPAADAAFADRADNMLRMFGQAPGRPLEDRPEIRVIDAGGIPWYYGPAAPGVFALAFNRVPEVPREGPDPGLPAGVAPVMAFAFDGPAAQPFFEMMIAQAGPAGPTIREQLDLYGLSGPEASSFSLAVGHGADRAHGAWRYTNYAPMAERWHSLVREPLTRRDLAMVPADATFAELGRYRLSGLADMLREFMPAMEELELEGMEDPFALFREHTGLDLERDLLAHFGDTYGFYMSDSTGGGGLMSSVFFLEVTEGDALDGSLRRLNDRINALTMEHAKGYVQVRTAQRDGVSLTTLMFPGLPVPLEISWTIADGYLIFGATPHAVIAALGHARGAGPSLLDKPDFLEMGGRDWEGATYVAYTDMPRLVRSGYGLTQLLCSAVANGVRSPENPKRDPGLILPAFNVLVDGAKSSVSMYRLDGNDLVGTFQMDRSVLVNVSGGLGLIGQSGTTLAMGALAGGVLLPSIAKAREQARVTMSSAQVRQLSMAMMTYAAEHDDAAPDSFDALRPYFHPALLNSPYGPVSDGRGDYWMNATVPRLSACRFPAKQIAFYDRAMYESAPKVAVGFYDGHVETMDTWALEALMAEEPNAGTDFDLPDGW
ncbi:MAG: hypothetical protein ACYTGC_18510, partial [Planctomycetota bacterium]